MSESRRRLAAIMFTDMVGYTALGQRNESLSLAMVEEQRELLRPIFSRHDGREVKTIGDAFLVEFPSALEAVRCAYDVQRATNEFNISLPEERRLHLRIGIHLGDVVESQGDISGDAVNVASRVESLAEDGGVCLTRQVYDHVQNKFEIPMTSLGIKPLKNLSAPLEVYKMEMPWMEERAITSAQFDKRRIAVLPFANISQDPKDEYFSDGLTDELITTLSQLAGLQVIARTSVIQYKGVGKKVSEIGRELEVGSVLEGSVRKVANKIRVTAQLIETATQTHIWTNKYDREMDDVFAIQSDIANSVAEALKIKLLSNVKDRLDRIPTKNTEAYTLYLKGRYYWNERTKDGMEKALKYFEEAVKLDSQFALAYSGLADCYVISSDYAWLRPIEAQPRAKEYALKAIEMDPLLAEPHASLGIIHTFYEYKWREAEDEFRRAIELNPSYATAYHWFYLFLSFIGRPEEAYEQIMHAIVLDPLSKAIGVNVGWAKFSRGEVKDAVEQMTKMVETNPDYAYAHLALGWTYYFESKFDEAIREARMSVVLSGKEPYLEAELACLLGLTGRIDEANKIIEELEVLSQTTYVDKAKLACALFGAGRTDEGFAYLEQGFEERADEIVYFRASVAFSDIRKDPRWVSLEKRMGLRGS